LGLVFQDHRPTFDRNHLKEGIRAPGRLGRLFGFDSAVPIIGVRHHEAYLGAPPAQVLGGLLQPRPGRHTFESGVSISSVTLSGSESLIGRT
jgi:hypothetical protein